MNSAQIEKWALDVIENVEKGRPNEDSRVELKSEWIEPQKAARQIAGHANAARGQPILWLIGVDQTRGVVGAAHQNLADWLSNVRAEFDPPEPSVTDLNIFRLAGTIVALLFDTDRAPFVVRNPAHGARGGGPISHEVPWREGTGIRTARRSDLIKLLLPIVSLPDFELLGGKLFAVASNGLTEWRLKLELYVVPSQEMSFAIPFHRCQASFEIEGVQERTTLADIRIRPPFRPAAGSIFHTEPDSQTVFHTGDEVLIQGPGKLQFFASVETEPPSRPLADSLASAKVSLLPTHFDRALVVNTPLSWEQPTEHELGSWVVPP